MSEWKKAGKYGVQTRYGQILIEIYPTELDKPIPNRLRWYCKCCLFFTYLESQTLDDAKIEAKARLRGILEEAVEAIRKEA